jgi:hypothetical protein
MKKTTESSEKKIKLKKKYFSVNSIYNEYLNEFEIFAY